MVSILYNLNMYFRHCSVNFFLFLQIPGRKGQIEDAGASAVRQCILSRPQASGCPEHPMCLIFAPQPSNTVLFSSSSVLLSHRIRQFIWNAVQQFLCPQTLQSPEGWSLLPARWGSEKSNAVLQDRVFSYKGLFLSNHSLCSLLLSSSAEPLQSSIFSMCC